MSKNLNIRISEKLREQSSIVLDTLGSNHSSYIREALQYVVNHQSFPWLRKETMKDNNSLQLIHKGALEAKKHLLLAHEATIDALQGVRNKYNETEKIDPVLEARFEAIFAEAREGLTWLDALINSTSK